MNTVCDNILTRCRRVCAEPQYADGPNRLGAADAVAQRSEHRAQGPEDRRRPVRGPEMRVRQRAHRLADEPGVDGPRFVQQTRRGRHVAGPARRRSHIAR